MNSFVRTINAYILVKESVNTQQSGMIRRLRSPPFQTIQFKTNTISIPITQLPSTVASILSRKTSFSLFLYVIRILWFCSFYI